MPPFDPVPQVLRAGDEYAKVHGLQLTTRLNVKRFSEQMRTRAPAKRHVSSDAQQPCCDGWCAVFRKGGDCLGEEEKEGGGKKKDAEKADHKGKESEDAMSVDAAPAALAT